MPTARRLARSPVGALVAFVAVAVYATWPLAARAGTHAVGDLADPLEQSWIFAWTAHALPRQPLALFDANIFWPERLSLAFSESVLGLSVPAAPVFWLTGNALATYNLAMIATYATGGFATYLLVRRLAGSAGAGFMAGAAFAVAPYRLNQVTHPHVVAVHLLPVVLLALLALRERRSFWRVAALAVAVAAQFWTSLTGGALTLVAVAAWGAWELLRLRRRALATLGAGLAGAALGVALAAPLLLTYAEVRRQYPEYRHGADFVAEYSAEPVSYLSPAPAGPVVRPLYSRLDGRFQNARGAAEKHLFPGAWLSVAFASSAAALGAALVRRRRDRRARPWAERAGLFAWLAAVGFALSLGPFAGGGTSGVPLPFWVVTKAVPGNLLRVPARFSSLVVFGMAVATGVALGAAPPRLRRVLVAASVLVLAVELAPSPYRFARPPPLTAAHRAVADREGAVLALPTVEFHPTTGAFPETFSREAVHLYASTAHFRPMTNGYAAFYPDRSFVLAASVQGFPDERALAALRAVGVGTVVVQTELVEDTPWEGVVADLRRWPGVRPVSAATGVEVFDISGAR